MTSERLGGDVKAAELQFMLALKHYVDTLVEAALAKHGLDAYRTPSPTPFNIKSGPSRWIYFIQGESGGPIKIGIADDPDKRLATLQRTSPVKLLILGQRPGDLTIEKALHAKFAEHRLHGEWFEPVDAILEEVEADSTERELVA